MKFAKLIKRFRIEKAHGFKLADFDPVDTCGMDIGHRVKPIGQPVIALERCYFFQSFLTHQEAAALHAR